MPRGVRTTTEGFGKDVFGEDTLEKDPVRTENVPISKEMSSKYWVQTGMSEEDVVRLDKAGNVLMFEVKEKFLPLSDAVVGLLSRENKTRYTIAKEFHDAWRGDEHAELVEKFQVDRSMSGSAGDKLTANVSRDLKEYWARPEKIETYRAKGWKIASADEAKSFLGPKGGHHEVGKLGQTELVLMVKPKKLWEKDQQKKIQKAKEMAGAWKQGASEIARAGGQGFVATEDDRQHRWVDMPGGEE